MKKREKKALNKLSHKTILLFFLVLLMIYLIISLKSSLFFNKLDRINIFKYDQNAILFSISIKDNSNYAIVFDPNLKLLIPGGYGYYRAGALGKVVKLENDNSIFKKTISNATSSFVQKYFYPSKPTIYYGLSDNKNIKLPGFKELIMYKSNSNFWDRIYLFFKFLLLDKNKINLIKTDEFINENNNKIFDKESFDKKYKGIFFQKSYRDEQKTVQILYSKNYDSAFIISQILEGNGIRVVDISQKDANSKKCEIIENSSKISKTAKSMHSYFNCSKKVSKTEISDIVMFLGNLEVNWSLR